MAWKLKKFFLTDRAVLFELISLIERNIKILALGSALATWPDFGLLVGSFGGRSVEAFNGLRKGI